MQAIPKPWPKFTTQQPRILLLTSQYFLLGELLAACRRLGLEHRLLDLGTKEMDYHEFVATMLATLDEFRPDFVLTVNHLGVDHEGVLTNLLSTLDIPLASWFVDNPHLILGAYANLFECQNALFTWDVDNIPSLEAMGFDNVFHLPLAADPTRLTPKRNAPVPQWAADISFVGNSMLEKTFRRLDAAQPSQHLFESGIQVAKLFGNSDEPSAVRFMLDTFPELQAEFDNLHTPQRQRAFETFITWQSTLMYRLDCVSRTLDFNPLIVGDPGWQELLKEHDGWRYHAELSYYDDLPDFYPMSKINFNCTSQQMKGAVNQRVFDVPCCGAFLLTDYRRQMEELFEPGKEIVYYNHPDEIPELVRTYLNDPDARRDVARAARKRVLAEHTYDHRMAVLVDTMRQTFE